MSGALNGGVVDGCGTYSRHVPLQRERPAELGAAYCSADEAVVDWQRRHSEV